MLGNKSDLVRLYPQNHVGRGPGGIRNGAKGAVRLPKILVLTIADSWTAQENRQITAKRAQARTSPQSLSLQPHHTRAAVQRLSYLYYSTYSV